MATTDVTRIGSNIGALFALNSLQNINKQLANHQTRLATGKRINSAADDPAGLSIASKMLARSEGLKVAGDNISDARNMLAVAEAGLSKLNDILIQMRSKAEQAASDTLGSSERTAIQTQLSSFAAQLDNIVNETKWNSVQLLDGTVNKRFQTGVDEGEYTSWTLSQKHDPTTLGVSTVVANNSATQTVANVAVASISGAAAPFTGLSRLSTGNYKIQMLDVAASATVGKVSTQAGSALTTASTYTLAAANNTGAEISSGTHTLNVVSYDGVNALVYNIDGGASANATMTGNAVNLGTTGLSLDLDTIASALSGSITFDYVQHNKGQYALKTASGENVAVDSDGVTGGASGSYFYAADGATYDTGRGLSMVAGTLAQMQAQENTGVFEFSYQQANAYSVNVSTAALASTYMTTATSALDTVSQSLANLGSLMARLEFKSDQVSTAQINVEASFNRIMNANMAEEQVNASKFMILQQTATAMLAQANVAPQFLLSLFK